jgi:hypothetical protein
MINFVLSLLAATVLHAEGFSSGSKFIANNLEGNAVVMCNQNGMSQSVSVWCTGDTLAPAEYDYFVSDESVDADALTLSATQQSGKQVVKTESYSPKTNRSSHFNLWIQTLTQKPLLNVGINKIKFEFKKLNKVVRTGEFIVEIEMGPSLRCANRSFYENSDCMFATAICPRYFQQENYCQ